MAEYILIYFGIVKVVSCTEAVPIDESHWVILSQAVPLRN